MINTTLENSARIIIWHNGYKDRNKSILATNSLFRNELQNLEKNHQNLRQRLDEIKSLHTSRNKRAVLPFVGDALSFLFGTLTSSDVEKITSNIKVFMRNQKTIAHVLNESLSVVKISRKRILENRQTIN